MTAADEGLKPTAFSRRTAISACTSVVTPGVGVGVALVVGASVAGVVVGVGVTEAVVWSNLRKKAVLLDDGHLHLRTPCGHFSSPSVVHTLPVPHTVSRRSALEKSGRTTSHTVKRSTLLALPAAMYVMPCLLRYKAICTAKLFSSKSDSDDSVVGIFTMGRSVRNAVVISGVDGNPSMMNGSERNADRPPQYTAVVGSQRNSKTTGTWLPLFICVVPRNPTDPSTVPSAMCSRRGPWTSRLGGSARTAVMLSFVRGTRRTCTTDTTSARTARDRLSWMEKLKENCDDVEILSTCICRPSYMINLVPKVPFGSMHGDDLQKSGLPTR
eukprot:PhM_4_TR13902/c0_g1_i1/m.96116